MKTATYTKLDGSKFTVEYDEDAPCIICGEPVVEASAGGTVICPWCDMGKCRYCGTDVCVLKEEIDGGSSLRNLRDHMQWHKDILPKGTPLEKVPSEEEILEQLSDVDLSLNTGNG